MPDLFPLPQLASYMQSSDLDEASADLARTLTASLIRAEVGPRIYDAMVDLSPFLPVALEVARRIMLNPSMLRSRSRQVDDYTETDTYASEGVGGPFLTVDEIDRVRRAAGLRPTGAFTIRPAGTPPRRVGSYYRDVRS